MLQSRWIMPDASDGVAPRLHSDPLLHQLLVRRGLETAPKANDFLNPRHRPAPNPSQLPHMDQAVERMADAIGRREHIGIFGDYDVDGVTSTAILTRALRCAASSSDLISATLPTREQGYGLNRSAIDAMADDGVTLLIAVDCGSGDAEHVSYARSIGLDVIALDHHQIPNGPAEGAIVVSPQLPGGELFRDLCAAGVAYLVICALARDGQSVCGSDEVAETSYLQYVALGTVADVVPVAGINRALLRDGLRQIQQRPVAGVAELCRSAGVNPGTITSEQIAFKLAPRLNAAGRMGNPNLALDLLLTDDPRRAQQLASELETLNERRRAQSTRVLREAEVMIASRPGLLEKSVLVLAGKNWPIGLLGPVASQLVDRYRRPVAVLSDDGKVSHGSLRSVDGFDVTAALKSVEPLLMRFGGHNQAAGLTLASSNIETLSAELDAAIVATGLEVPYPPVVRIDAELLLDRVEARTVELLQQLEPFGAGNEQPLLLLRGVPVQQWDAIGADRTHLRLQLVFPGGTVKGIAFGKADRSKEFLHDRTVDLAAVLKIDTWNGHRRLDIEVKDFRPAT